MSAQGSPNSLTDMELPPAGTARIGAELRQVRERAGWKLSDVAAELRIREPFLDAIERGELDALPGPAYQVGFVRAYAQALGLDGDEILRRFRAEGAGAAKKPELSFLAPVPDRAVPSGAMVLLGVVLLLVGYGLWYLHTESDRTLAASVPAVPSEMVNLALPPATPAKPAAPAVAQKNQPLKIAGAAPGTVPAATASATPPTATMSPTPAGAIAAAQPTATTAAAPASAATAAGTPAAGTPAAGTPGGKTILATADSWVEVKDASGNIVFSRLMHSGDRWPVPDLPGLTMTSGNAGGTEIFDDGNASQPLGAAGAVLRNYALTPAGQATAGQAPAVQAPAVQAPAVQATASAVPAMPPAPTLSASNPVPAVAAPSTVAHNPAKTTP
jgi:cytoskeleton protein RodZ